MTNNYLCCLINPCHVCEHCDWKVCYDCGEEDAYFKRLLERGELPEATREAFDRNQASILRLSHRWKDIPPQASTNGSYEVLS